MKQTPNPYTTGLKKVSRAWDEGYASAVGDTRRHQAELLSSEQRIDPPPAPTEAWRHADGVAIACRQHDTTPAMIGLLRSIALALFYICANEPAFANREIRNLLLRLGLNPPR